MSLTLRQRSESRHVRLGLKELPEPLRAEFGDIDIEGNLARTMAAGMQGGLDRPNGLLRLLNSAHEFVYNNANWGRARHNAELPFAQRRRARS
jgi:hypothetical protein